MTENFNGKRSNIISSLKRKNLKLVKQIKRESKQMENSDLVALRRFEKYLTQCANLTLYQQDGKLIQHVASHTCNHKACFVCNFLRQKKIRRKYLRWFGDNKIFGRVLLENGNTKIVTRYQYEKNYAGFEVIEKVPYDLMFLTLTVPHTEKGFRGETFYQMHLRKAFNLMRKTDSWLNWVYGGEFGIEITKSENGLHIHIHSLIFVKRGTQNRNKVHSMILKEWNKYTVDLSNKRTSFDEETIVGIKKGNSILTDKDINKLNPQGATIINLSTIYTWTHGAKKRAKEFGSKEMMIAVMEAISYHFEPQAFDKANGEFNIPLLIELLPKLLNLRIYDRFGILYKESPLSMTNNAYVEDLEEIIELKEGEESKEVISDKDYYITNPAYVFHDPEKRNKIIMSWTAKDRRIDLSAGNTSQAIAEMSELVKSMHTKNFQYS